MRAWSYPRYWTCKLTLVTKCNSIPLCSSSWKSILYLFFVTHRHQILKTPSQKSSCEVSLVFRELTWDMRPPIITTLLWFRPGIWSWISLTRYVSLLLIIDYFGMSSLEHVSLCKDYLIFISWERESAQTWERTETQVQVPALKSK